MDLARYFSVLLKGWKVIAAAALIGAVLVLVASGITIGYARLEDRRGTGPTVETPAVLGVPVSASPA